MKVISIKKFRPVKGESVHASTITAPKNGQLVRIKDKLAQFVIPSGADDANCAHCIFSSKPCRRIACGTGHFAEVKLALTPFTEPKETDNE